MNMIGRKVLIDGWKIPKASFFNSMDRVGKVVSGDKVYVNVRLSDNSVIRVPSDSVKMIWD